MCLNNVECKKRDLTLDGSVWTDFSDETGSDRERA